MTIIFAAGADDHLYLFERDLMLALVARGAEVYALSPPGRYSSRFANLKITHLPLTLSRRALNPFTFLTALIQLVKIFRARRPDALFTFTAKMNVLGNLAARLTKIKTVISSISGLGYAFEQTAELCLSRSVFRIFAVIAYRVAFRKTSRVIFENHEDATMLIDNYRVVRHEQALLTRGPGVDTRFFSPENVSRETYLELRRSLKIKANDLVVLMTSRWLKTKGVIEYCTAAELICRERQDTVFLLAGAPDPQNPASLPADFFTHRAQHIRLLGYREDIRELLALADIFTLPSYYQEGLPHVLLEALAMGRPIVTTDQVGCRETVEPGKNGWLIPTKDSAALATALRRLLDRPEQRHAFGAVSRAKAVAEFDATRATRLVLDELLKITAAPELSSS